MCRLRHVSPDDGRFSTKYGSLVAFEPRDFPLPKHDWARSAAIAARHFEKVRPEAAVEFRRFIYTRIKQTPVEGFEERVREFARDQGLDPSEAVSALRSRELDALVEKDYEEGVARGVSKVPTIYIEDRAFIEKFRRTDVAAAIDKALAK